MSEIGDHFKDIREARQGMGEQNRLAAIDDFPATQRRCSLAGLALMQHSEVHYSITHPHRGWRLNIYPGNRRIYMDLNRPRAPYLKLPEDWSLEDVITALIQMTHYNAR